MSRSGYGEDFDDDHLSFGRWRGCVLSALRGKRGQAFLREMLEALDALPEKKLAPSVLVEERIEDGEVRCCAMGAVALKRGLETGEVDPFQRDAVADLFGIAEAMAAEIAHENDDGGPWRGGETDEARWVRMRAWTVRHLAAP